MIKSDKKDRYENPTDYSKDIRHNTPRNKKIIAKLRIIKTIMQKNFHNIPDKVYDIYKGKKNGCDERD